MVIRVQPIEKIFDLQRVDTGDGNIANVLLKALHWPDNWSGSWAEAFDNLVFQVTINGLSNLQARGLWFISEAPFSEPKTSRPQVPAVNGTGRLSALGPSF